MVRLYGLAAFVIRLPPMPTLAKAPEESQESPRLVRPNPARLNSLQLKTLTLLQAIAALPDAARLTDAGDTAILTFPHMHGDHFHLGDATVLGRDATGLENRNVWSALARKRLIKCDWPHEIALTPEGLSYQTGIADQILHRGEHH
jgi:hypothetical protein